MMALTIQLGERTWQVHPPGGKLGRQQGLSVTIPDQTISGEHAEFSWDTTSQSWWIRPLREKNPVYLNGQELPLARLQLPPQGELILGSVAVRFSYSSSGTNTTAKDSAPPTLGPVQIKPGTPLPQSVQPMRGEPVQPASAPQRALRAQPLATYLGEAPPAYLLTPPERPGAKAPSSNVGASDVPSDVQRVFKRSQLTQDRRAQLAKQAGGIFAFLAALCILGWFLGARLAAS